jgi:hypothetical protein
MFKVAVVTSLFFTAMVVGIAAIVTSFYPDVTISQLFAAIF